MKTQTGTPAQLPLSVAEMLLHPGGTPNTSAVFVNVRDAAGQYDALLKESA